MVIVDWCCMAAAMLCNVTIWYPTIGFSVALSLHIRSWLLGSHVPAHFRSEKSLNTITGITLYREFISHILCGSVFYLLVFFFSFYLWCHKSNPGISSLRFLLHISNILVYWHRTIRPPTNPLSLSNSISEWTPHKKCRLLWMNIQHRCTRVYSLSILGWEEYISWFKFF